MTEKTLQDNGFAKYFEIGALEPGPRLNDFLRSHPQTPELFIGCKHKLLNETLVLKNSRLFLKNLLFQGIFISPKDLYLQTHFTYFDLSYARSSREYYVYYSDTYGEPFGFTEDQRIRLQGSDEFDCHNQGTGSNSKFQRNYFRSSCIKMRTRNDGRSSNDCRYQ